MCTQILNYFLCWKINAEIGTSSSGKFWKENLTRVIHFLCEKSIQRLVRKLSKISLVLLLLLPLVWGFENSILKSVNYFSCTKIGAFVLKTTDLRIF